MLISLFSVAILLIVATVAAIEIYRGICNGFSKSLISLGALIPCILFSLLLAPLLARQITSLLFTYALRPWWIYQYYAQLIPSLDPLIQAVAQVVVSLLLFVGLFFLLRPLARFVIFCQTIEMLVPQEDDPGYSQENHSFCQRHSKVLGGMIGGLCAIVISMVITCPIMGVLHIADSALHLVVQVEPEIWSQTPLTEEDVETLTELPDDLPGNLLYQLGGEFMFRSLAKTDIYGQTVSLYQELDALEETVTALTSAYNLFLPNAQVTPEDLVQLAALRDGLQKVNLCHGVISDYLSVAAKYWRNGQSYFYFNMPAVPAMVQPLFDSMLEVVAQSDHSNIRENIATLANMYILVLDSPLASELPPDALTLLSDPETATLLNAMEKELNKNVHMQQVDISAINMQLLRSCIAQADLYAVHYENLTGNLAKAVNIVTNRGYGSTQEQVAVLNTYAQKYFAEAGLLLPEFMATTLSTQLITLFDGTEVTSQQIQQMLENNT